MNSTSLALLVPAKVRVHFAPSDVERAMSELELYGVEPYEREVARVRLAILKLSGGSLEHLVHNVACAKKDYRDVLAWAEYPEELTLSAVSSAALTPKERSEREVVRRRDREQYEAWLSMGIPGLPHTSEETG